MKGSRPSSHPIGSPKVLTEGRQPLREKASETRLDITHCISTSHIAPPFDIKGCERFIRPFASHPQAWE